MDELGRVNAEQFRQLQKHPLICVLDNIRSQHNIGSVFRTADAFRLEKIFLCGITATPPNREIQKTALGSTESMDWQYFEDTVMAIRQLKSTGYRIIAIEQAEGSIHLQKFSIEPGTKLALVFGNEVDGVSEEVMQLVDGCVEIPQFGTKHSLNVSITAGIIIWHCVSFFPDLSQ